jgi:hypothetical protein
MPGFVFRVVPVALTLWLAACGAGGNNNIFDLHSIGRGAGDSAVLLVSVESESLRAAAVGGLGVSRAANGNPKAVFTLQS